MWAEECQEFRWSGEGRSYHGGAGSPWGGRWQRGLGSCQSAAGRGMQVFPRCISPVSGKWPCSVCEGRGGLFVFGCREQQEATHVRQELRIKEESVASWANLQPMVMSCLLACGQGTAQLRAGLPVEPGCCLLLSTEVLWCRHVLLACLLGARVDSAAHVGHALQSLWGSFVFVTCTHAPKFVATKFDLYLTRVVEQC